MRANLLQDRKALLLAVQTPDISDADLADSLQELEDLAASVGCRVVGKMVQPRARIHPGTYLGKGKLEQAKASMGNCGTDLVLFDNNLTPSQGDNLERALGEMVMDRTQLILEIFGRNVRTHESRIQVELAQLEYMLPRLVGMWAHLDRERGGIGGTKGAGEKQIDIDRSLIRQRIARLKKELRHIAQERHTQNKRRSNCFLVNLVGYTNAGKSTLMNRLTSAGVTVENRLFATLDPTTRVLTRENRPPILLSDTVGFLKRLPHELVASFHSTLEMVRDADLLLHVVDISHPQYEEQIAITEEVLREIGAATNPRMLVFNKTDRLDDKLTLRVARKRNPEAVFISALQDDGGELMAHINAFFEKSMVTTPLLLEYADYGDLSKIYKWGRVDELRYEDDGIHLTVTSTPANLERIRSKLPAAR
ncbi:MAG: GTPase HflX [SAR324 cluster bacterium]|nr:GTPase HflX [SAR324 cluster bacterium]MCZ6557830.1 GTPase HflX [SAR324 cluster bacterium]